ncbi:MAG: thioredoxin [Patescibacteria group bacterium]
MAQEFTDQNFEEEVIKSDKPVLVDFWAPWCGPCQMMGPIIDDLAKEYTDAKIGKVNVDDNPETAGKYEVMSIPTLIIFKDGKPAQTMSGVTSKEDLIKTLDELK